MKRTLLLIMTLALIPIVKSQSGNPELVKPAPLVKDAKILRPGEAILKSPSKTSVSGVRYRRPAGAFPAIFSYIVDNEDNKRFSGLMNTPHFFLMPYSKYTFQGTADGFDGASNFYWEYPSDNGQSVYYGKDFTMRFDLGYNHDAPIIHVDDGGSNYSYQMSGYRGESLDGHSFIVTDSIPSKIIASVECKSYMYMLLLSSKSFNFIGNYGSNTYTWIDWKSSQNLLPYANNDHAWFFGKNGGSVNGYRYDGIAQAFEKPEHPYRLKNIVAYVDNLTVTDPVKLTCNIYEMSEIPPYDDNNPVYLNVSPDRLIAYGEAWLTPETINETKGLIFFELWGEIDGLPFLATPLVDHPILVTIEDYNDPEMSNLVDFTFGTSSDVTIDEGFGELAYVKCAPTDENGNINGDYQWTGLNNFFDTGDGMCKTGFTVFLDAELPYVAFKDTNEIGEYVFPKEGGVMKRQIDGNMVSGLDFYSSTPYDEDHIWEITDTTYCDLPSWLEINLSNVLNDQGEFSGIVHAEVIAKPLPDYGYDSIRDMTVRFWPEYAPYIDFKFIQKRESQAIPKRGDVNGDGEVTIKDVTALIDYLLSDDASSIILSNADVDANGIVNIADVTCLIDHLLSGSWPDDPVTPPDEHEWVDLGLPSGTLWATCNVGANSPEEYGDYFAWGETEPKDFYDLSTYKWIDSSNMLIKYCTDSDYGTIDNKTELDPEDDAAYMNLGVLWRMPSSEQFQELCDECTWTWTTKSGVNGQLVTGPNGNTLFFPAAGYWFGSSIGGLGSSGHYWSCDLYIGYQYDACYIFFDSGNYGLWYRSRDYGRTVRAVRASQEPVQFQLSETEVNLEVGESKAIDILNGSGSYSVDGGAGYVTTDVVGNQLILTGVAAGSDNVIVTDAATNATASLSVTVTNPDTIQTTVFTVNGVSFTMVTVEGGTFTMGATAEQGDDAEEDEYPPHQVTLSNYAIGQTEVTQELWEAVMDENPSSIYGSGFNCPVDMIDAYWGYFIDRLRKLTGWKFRLPTEAEWEFAARGGNRSRDYKYAGSDNLDEVAWYRDNTSGSPESLYFRPVATKAPNELGLYDMSGNVRELCSDWYGEYSSEPQTNPTGPSPDSIYINVFRGGDSFDIDTDCRVSRRIQDSPYWTSPGGGFRLALDIDAGPMMCLSEAEVDLKVGETRTIDILHGSGNYHVGYNQYLNVSTVGDQLVLTGVKEGVTDVSVYDMVKEDVSKVSVTITKPDSIQIEHEWVDLGLPSGTLWATCNVGANAPEEYGDYFAWGETEPKDYYDWNTYKWCNNGDYYQLTKYCTKSEYGYNGFVDNKSELDPEDDAAYVNWGENWRMPTYDQQKELLNKCTWTWTTQNGVNGYLVTGPNSASLFLPAAGSRWSDYLASAGTYGEYWSRPLDSTHPCNADIIGFNSDERGIWHVDRNIGHSVRAVRVSQN